MAYTFRNWSQDKRTALTNYLVGRYNEMIDSTMVQETTTEEMTKILQWSFEALHRLYPLAILDDNGLTFQDLDAFDLDEETALELFEVLGHNIILLVNNWRQTQFFQKDDNGKDVRESKYNPVDNTIPDTTALETRAAIVSYNLFDINLKADKNLAQVSQILKQIKAEYEQYLDIYGGATGGDA